MGCGCVSQSPGHPRRFLHSLSDADFVRSLKPDEQKDKTLLLEYYHLYHDNQFQVTPQLQSLARQKGVPQRFRWRVWKAISGWKLIYRPGVYDRITACEPPPGVELSISKDLERIFPRSEQFDEDARKKLASILKAYAVLHPQVGYVQGMGFVAGFLLMAADSKGEEETFFMFCRVMISYKACLLYCESLPLYKLLHYQFEVLLNRLFPDIAAHMKRLEVFPELYVTKWIMCLFTRELPLACATRLWDLIICDGVEHAIVPLALAVVKLLKQRLLQEENLEAIADLLTFQTDVPPPDKVVKAAISFQLKGQLAKLTTEWAELNPLTAEELEQKRQAFCKKGDDQVEVPAAEPRAAQASGTGSGNLKTSPTTSNACAVDDAVAKAVNNSVPASPFSTALEAEGGTGRPATGQQLPQLAARSKDVSKPGGDMCKTASEDAPDGDEATSSKGLSPRTSGHSAVAPHGGIEGAASTSGRLYTPSSSRSTAAARRKQVAQPQGGVVTGEVIDPGGMAAAAPPLSLRNLSRPESLCSSARRSEAKGIVHHERESQRENSPRSPDWESTRHHSSATDSPGNHPGSKAPAAAAEASGAPFSSSDGSDAEVVSALMSRQQQAARQLVTMSLPEGSEHTLPPIRQRQETRARLPVREPGMERSAAGRVVRSLSPSRRGKQELPPLCLPAASRRASSGERAERPERRGSTPDMKGATPSKVLRAGSAEQLMRSGGSTPGGATPLSTTTGGQVPRQVQALPPQFPRMPLQPLRQTGHDSLPNSPPESGRINSKHQRVASAATCPDLDDRQNASPYGDDGDYADTNLASTMPSLGGDRSHTPGSNWSQDSQVQLSTRRSANRPLTKQGSMSSNFAPPGFPAAHAIVDPPQDGTPDLPATAGVVGMGVTEAARLPWGSNARSAAAALVTDSPEAPYIPAPSEVGQPHIAEASPKETRKRSAWESPSEVVAAPGDELDT